MQFLQNLVAQKIGVLVNQTSSGAGHIEDFIKRLKNFNFEPGFDNGSVNHIVYEPIGVCGLITPWNWPINQIALKVIPAFCNWLYNDIKTI